jgi:hypothetical protein
LLGNGSVKIPVVARQRLGKNVTAVTNIHATIEELLDTFPMWPVSYQGKYAINSSQNFLLDSVDVGSVAYVSEVYAASIFRVDVSEVRERSYVFVQHTQRKEGLG